MADGIDFGRMADLAQAVRSGGLSAVRVTQAALNRIEQRNPAINAVTVALTERALAEAAVVDAKIAAGQDAGPLAGVPYGVKDLFDVAGLPTTAGAGRLRDAPPATADAEAIRRLTTAGAVLVARLNMDEFAYGFVTDNAHWGLTRNPHDVTRFAGGSSGGSAAAVAGGLVSFALGSDTNGSIRIPASFCGLHGIKPTHGSLPMAGVYPFVETLDDVGVLTVDAAGLAMVDRVLRGGTGPAIFAEPARIALPGRWFARNLAPELERALAQLSAALDHPPVVEFPAVEQARSAAFVITAYEGGALHRDALRYDALSFDPATRDRLIAGAAIPDAVYREALALRQQIAAQMDDVFRHYDVLIAPATYGPAPLIDHPFIPIDGTDQPARANLGLYTQPVSFLGLPVVAVPLAMPGAPQAMPLGLQLIGAPGTDARLIAYAAELEARGLTQGRAVAGKGA